MEAGAKVYYPDPAEAYLVATVKHVAGLGADAELTLVPEKGGELKKVAKECSEADLKSLDGVPDMQQMDSLTEASLLGCLREGPMARSADFNPSVAATGTECN